jgi:hypothetical protein
MNPGGLFVSSSGLVGIGNVIPAYTLDVSGTGRFTNSVTFATSVINYVGAARLFSGNGSTINYLYTGTTQLSIQNAADSATVASISNTGAATFSTSLTVSSTTNAGLISATNSTTGYAVLDLINNGTSGKNYQIGVGGNAAASGYANNLYFIFKIFHIYYYYYYK